MKHFQLCRIAIFLLAVSTCFSQLTAADAAPHKLVVERNDDIWIANVDGTSPKKIATGQFPDLSPDGTKIAYTMALTNSDIAPRSVAIFDLASGKSTVLKSLPNDSYMNPQWSPDGKQLLVSYMIDSKSHIGIANADGTSFRAVQDSDAKTEDYWSAAWAADSQSLFAQDMENLYHLDLNGKVLKKWVIEKLVPKGSMSSAINLNPSPDGKTLLMDVEMDEKEREGWDGPPPAIWLLDLATEKVTRLTPFKFYAWSSRWLNAPDSVLYVSQKPDQDFPCIYRMSITGQGKDSTLILKNASFPGTPR